jgi:hypothetical protein
MKSDMEAIQGRFKPMSEGLPDDPLRQTVHSNDPASVS